jgi:hypothetical protein
MRQFLLVWARQTEAAFIAQIQHPWRWLGTGFLARQSETSPALEEETTKAINKIASG